MAPEIMHVFAAGPGGQADTLSIEGLEKAKKIDFTFDQQNRWWDLKVDGETAARLCTYHWTEGMTPIIVTGPEGGDLPKPWSKDGTKHTSTAEDRAAIKPT